MSQNNLRGREPKLNGHILPLGYDNYVRIKEVVGFQNPKSMGAKHLRDQARMAGRLIDVTHGQKTRAMVVMKNHQIWLSAYTCETLQARAAKVEKGGSDGRY